MGWTKICLFKWAHPTKKNFFFWNRYTHRGNAYTRVYEVTNKNNVKKEEEEKYEKKNNSENPFCCYWNNFTRYKYCDPFKCIFCFSFTSKLHLHLEEGNTRCVSYQCLVFFFCYSLHNNSIGCRVNFIILYSVNKSHLNSLEFRILTMFMFYSCFQSLFSWCFLRTH